MADFGRVAKDFYEHPKALKARAAEPGSISLWLFANCWCRSHRKQGIISREEALHLGSEAEIQALVDSGLWIDIGGDEYQFHHWTDWNPDLVRSQPKASAAWIVRESLPNHPMDVQKRVTVEVEKLIDEGLTKSIIESALRKWGSRPDARVTWIPYFASDAIREGETGISGAIKEARRTWNMSPLREYGWYWQAPDPPTGAKSAREIREFMQARKREWLDMIEAKSGKNSA